MDVLRTLDQSDQSLGVLEIACTVVSGVGSGGRGFTAYKVMNTDHNKD
jgi:hypothetical protein